MSFPEEIAETQILAALLGIAQMVGDLTDTQEMLESVVRIAPSLVRVDRCAVLVHDETAREFRTWVAFGPGLPNSPFAGLRIPDSDVPRLAHRLLTLRLPAVVKPDSKDLALPPAVVQRLGLRAALLVPLVCRGRVLGILWVDHTSQSHYFTSKEINVIQGIATSMALALDDAARLDSYELERRRFDALARALADGVIALAPDGRIREMDHGAEDILGWQSSEIKGRRVHEVLAIAESDVVVGRTKEGAEPPPVPKRLTLRAHDGTAVSCVVHVVPVRSAAGDTVQILFLLRKLRRPSAAAASDAGLPEPPAQRVAPPE